ncbi:MAG: M23 family metallopeptidase [Acidobacteria bacterium]|nr:M23 family metallopeptidase [Acidobacteriota bacterium]
MSFKTILLLILAVALVAGGITFYLAGHEPGPLVHVYQPAAVGGGGITVEFTVDAIGTPLTRLDVALEQQGRVFPVFSLAAPGSARFTQETADRIRITQVVPASGLTGLRDGTARLTVTAVRSVLWGVRHAETVSAREVKVRTTPPVLSVVSTHHYVRLGGAEMIVYRVNPPDATSGVEVGDHFFPGFPAAGVNPARKDIDPSLRVSFFGLLYDQDLTTPIRLVARDVAGNSQSVDFDHKTLPSEFERRRVPIDDAFLQRVVPGILAGTPDLTLATGTPDERLQAFLTINSEVRRKNEDQIEKIAGETSPELLWHGTFQRMSRAQSEAVFADHRTYMYDDREVDQQVHLGADLASTRGAVITAANAGHILFSGFLGIYGNCVILDHGMGVQSLYAHLSTADVEAGDRVERGETIGHSGSTGLAGGDHLHFTMLLGGRPVNPIEWWDPHWIADRVQRKLVDAGLMDRSEIAAPPPAAKTAPARVKPKTAPKRQPPAPARRKR